MTRQKRIFIFFAVLFFLAMAYVAYDISRRTTFPGSKPQLQERIKNTYSEQDSVTAEKDSVIQR
ncbi:MAG: hypothetical protein P8X57_11180 [Cyclobacteriaceae bacterium]